MRDTQRTTLDGVAYRREIDGLRALAIVPVILFHAGFSAFSGGFVGVDVFFVISGYLISIIIFSELERNLFSITNFYERRARRILPALFLVMFVCLPFAWLWLLPQDMKSFSQSLLAASASASNVLFWRTSGYFDTASELKPLLHTWSLAVEEQYYLFFPIFLVITWRIGKARLYCLLVVVLVMSLAAAQWASSANPVAGYYLLPTRGWELLIGALTALLRNKVSLVNRSQPIAEVGGFLGLALLIYAIYAFNQQTPFPSLYTLVPTIGAAILILCSTQSTVVGRLLANRVLVGIGLISYSTYLWHQPIFAFARHISSGEPSKVLLGELAIFSLVLGSITWKYVEVPFRRKNYIRRETIFVFGLVGTLFFIILGLAGHVFHEWYKDYWLSRQRQDVRVAFKLIEEAQKDKSQVRFAGERFGDGECRFNVEHLSAQFEHEILTCFDKYGKGVAVLGDSHAIDTFAMVLYSSKERFLIGVTKIGCRPYMPASHCQYEEFLSFIERHPNVFSGIIYDQAGFYLLKKSGESGKRGMFSGIALDEPLTEVSVDEGRVHAVYNYLSKLGRYVRMVWIGPRFDPHISEKAILKNGCTYPYSFRTNQREAFISLDRFIERLVVRDSNIKFVSQQALFSLEFPKDFMTCDQLFWLDGDHLSLSGIENLAGRFDLISLTK